MPDSTRTVLYRGRALPLDPATCRDLGAGVFADASTVWFGEQRVDLDPSTARRVGAYLWDAARVHLLDEFGSLLEVDADAATFEAFAVHAYARDAKGVVFGNRRIDLPGVVLDDLDGCRTRAIDTVLVIRDAVFVDGVRHEADPNTVAILGERPGSLSRPAFRFLVDRERVWPARSDYRRIATYGQLGPGTLGERLDTVASQFRCEGDWAFDGARAWHGGTEIQDAHAEGIVILSDDWARIDARIYYRAHPTDADPWTFEALGGDFGRDSTRVWHAGEHLEELDAATTVLCCEGGGLVSHGVETCDSLGVLRDASGVWRLVYADSDYSCGSYVAAIEGADPATFRIVDNVVGLAVDASGVWLVDTRIHTDPEALVILGGGYWKVAGAWYWSTTRLRALVEVERVFPETGHLIGMVRAAGAPRSLGNGYLHNDVAVWHRSTRLEIDPEAAHGLGSGFVRNRDGVYRFAEIMTSRKVVEFESMGGLLEGADPATFATLGDDYGVDADHVYFMAARTEIDRASVQLLTGGWARDKARIYCYGLPVDADPAAFRVLGGCRTNTYAGGDHGAYARDAQRVFRGASALKESYSLRNVDVNESAFELRGECFATDGRHVFALGRPRVLDGADAATFTALVPRHRGSDRFTRPPARARRRGGSGRRGRAFGGRLRCGTST